MLGGALEKISGLGRLLNSYSYKNVLKRGFALVSNNGHVLSSAQIAESFPVMDLTFSDGTLKVAPFKGKKTSDKAQMKPQADLFQK
ncbi:MAG: hypothetical protein ACI4OR_03475 [Alphaproteobacteria bacterium]